MPSIMDILALKDRQMITISPDATIFNAAALMTERKIGSLLVVENERLVGIITERDFMVNIATEQRDAHATPVSALMECDVFCCRPHTELEEAKSVMKHRRVRHLPVMDDDDHLVGVISIGDLNAYQTDSQERTIYLLHEYIQGQR